MTYFETLKFIHSLNKFGIKPGLERIIALLNKLGNPQDDLAVIHVAGTNGKGSTSTALCNILKVSGKKTGLFISPFVIDFRERIQINGEYISEEDLTVLTEKVSKILPQVEKEIKDNVTEFEFITAVAFLYFKEKGCEYVVLETGLGGRLDSTNVIKKPLATVITKVALDHVGVLGSTIEEIAREKAGIIKANCPVITSSLQQTTTLSVINKVAESLNAPAIVSDISSAKNVETSPFGTKFDYKGLDISLNLSGRHQVENMILAIDTALLLGIDERSILNGVSETIFPARLEVISKQPLVILDGAHNSNGADALTDYLKENNLEPVIILGMMSDKDCKEVVKKIATVAKAVFTVKVESNVRTETAETLCKLASAFCKNSFASVDYNSALCSAYNFSKSNQNLPIVICGSLYLASDIRNLAINYFKK